MFVIKRDGSKEQVKFEKVSKRITRVAKDLKNVDPNTVAQKVIQGIYDGVSTVELDKLAIEVAYSMTTIHYEYDRLAVRLAVSNLHKNTPSTFSEAVDKVYNSVDVFGKKRPLIAEDVYTVIKKNAHIIDSKIDYDRDYLLDYFGFKTLERSYLLKTNEYVNNKLIQKIAFRPQHLWMMVSVGIHKEDIDAALETYEMLSKKEATHATPTLFNAGLIKNQLSSCFLIAMKEDSIPGIYDTLKETALISQSAGGIGLHIHDIRCKGSAIFGTGGTSNGIIPMLKNFHETAKYVDQCFAPNTIVYTKKGPFNIQDINIGDELISHDGSFNRVRKVLKTPFSGNMVSLSVKQSLRNVLVKEDHLFLALKNQQKGINFSVIKNRLDKNLTELEWIEAKNLTENDLITFPIHTYENDIPEYTFDDCVMYGLLLGDGWIHKNMSDARLYLDKTKDDLNFVRKYLNQNLIPFSEYDKGNNDRVTVFRWVPDSKFKFSRAMLYDLNAEKTFHHSMLHLPKEKIFGILKGLMESDGHNGNELLLEMSSKNVIESLRYCLLRFGILTCGYDRDRIGMVSSYKNITTKKPTYVLRIPKLQEITDILGSESGQWTNYFTHNNIAYARVSDLQLIENYNDMVYDFEVEPNHSYLTEIGMAHNGGGKRKGSFAIYLEPWHADIFEFLDLRKNNGKEELRARDLNLALWIPDLFFNRVKEDGKWTLIDPTKCPNLSNVYGEEFNKLYIQYEQDNMGERTINARDLWSKIVEAQIETGQPYMLAKDACNIKSNQKNLGTIKSSNLCSEIIEYSDAEETAVCNLASISLPSCVDGKKYKRTFNFQKLYDIAYQLTINLNKVIDIEFYPVETAKKSNLKHRPIGIGIQGLADVFALMRFTWDSSEALLLNQQIAETMYYAALTASADLAKKDGAYESYPGSPLSEGIFQFDMWNTKPTLEMWDWEKLKKKIKKTGVRNSLLLTNMPTASTSNIMGNTECFEPITSNIYTRQTLSGEFAQVNKYLLEDLVELNIWNDTIKQKIIASNGSIQNIMEIPDDIKSLYKTVWEISQRVIIDMAAARGPFICQSQSMNLYIKDANTAKVTSALFYAWEKGLKTLVYYLRSNAARETTKFTVSKEIENQIAQIENSEELVDGVACSLDNPEACEMCSG